MNKKQLFAKNLSQAIQRKGLTYEQAARKAGLPPKTLYRWLQEGINRVNHRTESELHKLCEFLAIDRGDLWRDPSKADDCAEKIRKMVMIWERAGVDFSWIDDRHLAVHVAERFRREAGDLSRRVRDAYGIKSEARLQKTLEEQVLAMLKESSLTEQEAYKKLKEWSVGLED